MTTQPADDAALFSQLLGIQLRVEREKRGLTRADIVEATGLSRATMGRIETGASASLDVVQLAQIVSAISTLDAPEFPELTIGDVVERAQGEMVTRRSRAMPDDA